jgi:hypothetical protein
MEGFFVAAGRWPSQATKRNLKQARYVQYEMTLDFNTVRVYDGINGNK